MTISAEHLFAALNLPGKTTRKLHSIRELHNMERFELLLLEALELFPDAYAHGNQQLAACDAAQIEWLTISDALYPEALKASPEAPFVLFYRGNSEALLKSPKVAIVGSRNADRNGLEYAKLFAETLALQSACIVSGLALGVDAAAHRGSLTHHIPQATIAVLAHGLDTLYPRTNAKLAEEIIAHEGLLLSQFPPGIRPLPQHFLIRNMVIAGLSNCTVVVQAGERSGSLVTARFAFETGREVCAIPGAPGDPRHAGTNKLIKEGAHLVCTPDDITAIVPGLQELSKPEHAVLPTTVTDAAKEILRYLEQNGNSHYSEIHAALTSTARLHQELVQLQLDGLIQNSGGNYYCLNPSVS